MSGVLKKALELLIGVDEPLFTSPPQSAAAPAAKKPSKKRPLAKLTERELIQLESEIGASLFGAVPKEHRREFFNLDPSTWIWYDESIDSGTDQKKQLTIRYEVHKNGILKVQEGARYDFIEGKELENFVVAVQLYYERVQRHVYHREPHMPSMPAVSA